jgi:hypothetical protein
VLSGFGEAVAAVNRLVAPWLEWNFGLFSTLGAGSGVHLARTAVVISATISASSFGSSGGPARGTTLGLIGKALG